MGRKGKTELFVVHFKHPYWVKSPIIPCSSLVCFFVLHFSSFTSLFSSSYSPCHSSHPCHPRKPLQPRHPRHPRHPCHRCQLPHTPFLFAAYCCHISVTVQSEMSTVIRQSSMRISANISDPSPLIPGPCRWQTEWRNPQAGWQNLAAFRREQKWQWKFLSSAYLQFSRQMRRFCA